MSQQRKIRRNSGVSQREKQRIEDRRKKSDESVATKVSRIAILVVFAAMVVSLAYTVVIMSAYN